MAKAKHPLTRAEHQARQRTMLKTEHRELRHTWRHLTRAEIDLQYTPERIDAMLHKASLPGPGIDEVKHLTI